MIELAQNLVLNRDVLNDLSDGQKSVFIYEWLCFLNKVLLATEKNDLRNCQLQIIEQLLNQISSEIHPANRRLIGRNLAILFHLTECPTLVQNTIQHCNQILQSNNQTAQLTTIVIIGELYQRLARTFHQTYEETINLLLKLLKNGDSQIRCEILLTFERIINGLGSIGRNLHREIFKTTRIYLTDRVLSVRSATAMCLIALINQNSFMYTSEFESNLMSAFRAFENANSDVRYSIGKFLARLLSATQDINSEMTNSGTQTKKLTLENLLNHLAEGFLRGGKSTNNDQYEIRIGITHTYIEFFRNLTSSYLEENLSLIIHHILDLASNPRLSTTHIDSLSSRQYLTSILYSLIHFNFNDQIRYNLAKQLINILSQSNTFDSSLNSSTNSMIQSYISTNPTDESSQTSLHCALNTLNYLIEYFQSSFLILFNQINIDLMEILFSLLINSSYSVRLTIAWCFRSIAFVRPICLTYLIDKCLDKINELIKQKDLSQIDTISAYVLVLQGLLGIVHQSRSNLSSTCIKQIFDLAMNFLRTAISSTIGQEQYVILRVILQQTHFAWHLLSACCTLDEKILKIYFRRLNSFWRNVFPRSQADFEQEKQRADLFTWILSFNQRSNALCSINSYLNTYSSPEILHQLIPIIDNLIPIYNSISNLLQIFGYQLKLSTILFRLRFYEFLLFIPNEYLTDHLSIINKELINEFTLIDSSIDLTTSLLKRLFENHSYSIDNFGTLEYDESYLYRRMKSSNLILPQPLPLSLTIIDKSIELFSRIFVYLSTYDRMKIIEIFFDRLKQSKDSRRQSIQINLITTIYLSLQNLVQHTKSLPIDNNNEFNKLTCTFIIQFLNHSNSLVRYASAQSLVYLNQFVRNEQFMSEIVQFCFEHFKDSKDIQTKIGYSLAIASLYQHKQMKNINEFIHLCFRFYHEQTNLNLQLAILHSFKLLLESNDKLSLNSIELILEFILQLLLSTSFSQIEIYQYSARLLSTLIQSLGNDLQLNTDYISTLRSSCLTAIHLLYTHENRIIQSESINAYQQMYCFASKYVNLSELIPDLIQGLINDNQLFRQACISCLKQIIERESKEVYKYAIIDNKSFEQYLFDLMNLERTSSKIYIECQQIIDCLVQTFGLNQISNWIEICRYVFDISFNQLKSNEEFLPNENSNQLSMKSSTKLFALNKLVSIFELNHLSTVHFDSNLAREQLASSSNQDYLVLHLNQFLTIAYYACQSIDEQLHELGLKFLNKLIEKFSSTEYHTFKQFENVINSIIRSCFSPTNSSQLTIEGCHVCTTWIIHSITIDRRFDQLLRCSLQKFTSIKQQTKNETYLFFKENLVILKLWSDIYNFLIENHHSQFLNLIQTELSILIHHWLTILVDPKSIMLSNEFSSILQSTTHWLVEHQFDLDCQSINSLEKDRFRTKLYSLTFTNQIRQYPEKKEDIFLMLFTCCAYALRQQTNPGILISIENLLQTDFAKYQITNEMFVELIELFQRQSSHENHIKIIHICKEILHLCPSMNFSIFQYFLSILMKFYPNLIENTSLSSIISIESTKNLELISLTIQSLYELIKLSPTDEYLRIEYHLFLSISYHILSTKSDHEMSLLVLIIQFIDKLSYLTTNQTILHSAINIINNLRKKLIEQNLSDNGCFIRCLTSLLIQSHVTQVNLSIIEFYRTAFYDRQFETHYHLLQCFNRLFQMSNKSLRNQFIRHLFPLLIIDLKQSTHRQYLTEIFQIFEILLSIVDSNFRLRLSILIIPLFFDDKLKLNSYLIERIQHLEMIYSNEFEFIWRKFPNLKVKFEQNK